MGQFIELLVNMLPHICVKVIHSKQHAWVSALPRIEPVDREAVHVLMNIFGVVGELANMSFEKRCLDVVEGICRGSTAGWIDSPKDGI